MDSESDEASPPTADNTKESSPNDIDDSHISPAVQWEDPGVYLLTAESVQEIANSYIDAENKKTRLNNASSLWSALQHLQLPMPGLNIPTNKKIWYKFPPQVVAQKSWDAALTNAIIYATLSSEEQDVERLRFRKANGPDKSRWYRAIKRLHKERFRRTGQPLDRPKKEMQTRQIENEPPSPSGAIDTLGDAMDAPMNLESFVAHGTDPDRVKRIRQLVGYEPEQAAQHLEKQKKRKEEAISIAAEKKKRTEEAAADGEKQIQKKKDKGKRFFGNPPKSISQQFDSCARKAAISAIQQTAKYIQTIHYPNDNGNTNQALHSMMLVIYNDVEKSYNPKGGRPKAGKKADVYDLTVVAYDETTCLKIITALSDQCGNIITNQDDGHIPTRPPCTTRFIQKMDGKTLMESAHEFLEGDNNSNQHKRRSRRDVTVCVCCNADLNKASYAQLKDKPTSVACTHALCMVCFGQAHVNRSMSTDPRLQCLSETCNHSSLVWNVVTYDGTKHLESVEQMIPHEPNILKDGEKRPKRRRTKAEMQEMRDRHGYVDRAWRRYHGEDFADYRPRSEIEADTSQRKKFGDPPRSVGGQVDSLARKAVKSSIHMMSKFTQTVHFPNEGDTNQALHSMALIIYNDVAKQANAFGGRLSNAKRVDYELTVLAYDNLTCSKILTALMDQFGYRDGHLSNIPRPPCKRQFIHKLEGMTMMESVETFL